MAENFKLLKEESYESIRLYLDCIISISKEIGIPAFIEYDGKKILVDKLRNDNGFLYTFAYESKGKMKSFGLSVPDHDPRLISVTDGVVIYRDFSSYENPFVIKENLVNNNTEQVFFSNDLNGKKELVYNQHDADRNIDCDITYDLTNFTKNLQAYMTYINNKYPKSFVLSEEKRLLGFIKTHSEEIFRYSEGAYLIPTFKFFSYEFASVKSETPIEDVQYHMRENGFNSTIPKPIGSILVGTNETVKTLKKVASIYDENLMKTR